MSLINLDSANLHIHFYFTHLYIYFCFAIFTYMPFCLLYSYTFAYYNPLFYYLHFTYNRKLTLFNIK